MIPMLLLVAGIATCPIVGSIYALDNDPNTSIVIREIPSKPKHLYLTFSDKSQHKMWFTLDAGSAQSSVRMVSSKTDPGESTWQPDPDSEKDREVFDQRYFLFKADGSWEATSLAAIELTPNGMAPDVIFVPDLSETLWYKRDPRLLKPFPGAVFRRKRCGSK
jgi:hypothetical protein